MSAIRLNIADFKNLRINQEGLFYTHANGYKMSVYGVQEHNGNVSIITHLIENQFNQQPNWPFEGEITIQIMNRDGGNHIIKTIYYNNDTPDGARELVGYQERSQGFRGCTLAQNELQPDPHNNIRYWNNDNTLQLCVTTVQVKLDNITNYYYVDFDYNEQINQEMNFNTHICGYRMSVHVVREHNGNISIITYLLASEFTLSWPFRGEITIQIVNRDGCHGHITRTIHYNNETPDGARRVEGGLERSEGFRGCTFPENDLGRRKIRYWSDDHTLHLRVIKVKPNMSISLNGVNNDLQINQEMLFNTHTNGYRMFIRVQVQNEKISIITHLLQSQFNQHLSWPFGAEITIQIVNRDGDHHHITRIIRYNNNTPDSARVILTHECN